VFSQGLTLLDVVGHLAAFPRRRDSAGALAEARGKATKRVRAAVDFSFIFINQHQQPPPRRGIEFFTASRSRAPRTWSSLSFSLSSVSSSVQRGDKIARTHRVAGAPFPRALLPYSSHRQARIKQRARPATRTGVTLRPRTMCVTLSSLDILRVPRRTPPPVHVSPHKGQTLAELSRASAPPLSLSLLSSLHHA